MLGPFDQDRARAQESFRRLAGIDVDLVCFGHGQPLRGDDTAKLRAAATANEVPDPSANPIWHPRPTRPSRPCRAAGGVLVYGTKQFNIHSEHQARRLSSWAQAVRHTGLDVTVYASDGKRTPGHLSHQGPPIRLIAFVPYATISGLAGAIVVGPVLGALTGHLIALWWPGALPVFAVGAVTLAFQTLSGVIGIDATILVFVILGNPSGGGAYQPGLLPPF